ncbi:MAG: hypothetical protein IPH33_12980 [Bacteroidetes bacterium]|nr:hypothetical protein [Bacteroidota bacterium]
MSLNFVSILDIFFETIGKNGSIGFAKCRLVFWANQMCHLCGWLKLFLKNVWWKKIKIQKRWLSGRLSDGSFVQSLVYAAPWGRPAGVLFELMHLVHLHPDWKTLFMFLLCF